MSKIGIGSSGSVNYFENDKNISSKAGNLTNNNSEPITPVYSNDTSYSNKKVIVSDSPFGKPVSNNTIPLEDALKAAREKKDCNALFNIAKIQYEQNIIPGIKPNDLFKEVFEMAMSEMDSDVLYEIGNFDAAHQVLPGVSSEFIFKMADMTRKIY